MYTSRLARLAAGVAVVAAVLFVAPPLASLLGLVDGFIAFRVFFLGGVPLGLLALVLGVAGLYTTRPAAGRDGRGRALLATGIGAAIVVAAAVAAGPGAGLPPINDITTDLEDPPRFVAATELPGNAGRDLAHPGEEMAAQQRAGYPELGPLRVARPPSEVFAETVQAMEGFGWEVHHTDPEAGRIEATDTSRVFRFVDDIVVRLRAQGDGTRVDVRSKSRVGRGDLGANAARIRRLEQALTG